MLRDNLNDSIHSTDKPKVSIVMPAFNAARYIEQAVGSVIEQTYQNWELLIVDDASNDQTLEIARKLAAGDARIRVFTNDHNLGVAESRNLALREASGCYIAFLDSDDLWLPEKLAKQVEFMLRHDVAVCYANYRRIDEHGNSLGAVVPPNRIDYELLLKSNFIGNLTGIYNAGALGKQYFSKFGHEDYVAWLDLVRKTNLACSVGEELALYRVYGGSISGNKLKAARWQWKIYRNHLSLGIVRSFRLMLSYFYYALRKRVPG